MKLKEIASIATAALAGVHHLMCGSEIAICEEIVEAAEHYELTDPDREYAHDMQRLLNQFPVEIAAHLP